jgi:putative redox protein
MIRATSDGVPYRVTFTDGRFTATSDTTAAKGGGDAGFGPFELLEAALASCLTITLEKTARHHSIPLELAGAKVRLDRSRPGEPVLTYELELHGPLTDDQRRQLADAAANCPVGKTLAGAVSVRSGAVPE